MDLLIIHIEDQAWKIYNVFFKFKNSSNKHSHQEAKEIRNPEKSLLYKSLVKVTPDLDQEIKEV